jgi:hypothetical protein
MHPHRSALPPRAQYGRLRDCCQQERVFVRFSSFWRQLSMIHVESRPSSSTTAESDSEADVRAGADELFHQDGEGRVVSVVRVALSNPEEWPAEEHPGRFRCRPPAAHGSNRLQYRR